MEQHEASNRLYWLARNGHWKYICSFDEEVNLNVEIRRKMGANIKPGIVGYSRVCQRYTDGWKTYWYEHEKCSGSFTRSLVNEADVPKPIRLLEMLQ